MEKMCETLLLLRTKYHFNGYIHVKTIPGASDELLAAAGYLADRISVNMELPTEEGLRTLAPNKTMQTILDPMGKVRNTIASHRMAIGKSAHMERSKGNQFLKQSIFGTESKKQFADGLMKEKKAVLGTENVVRDDAGAYGSIDQGKNHGTGSGGSVTGETDVQNTIANLAAKMNGTVLDSALTWDNAYQLAPFDMSKLKRRFAPAGQSTQMIVGATAETDKDILFLSSALYQRPTMRRVYYSGYISVNTYDKRLPALKQPPLVRENRLYQADWLLRFYQFKVDEIVDDAYPDLDLEIDPKLSWALRHPEQFPVDVNKADYEMILRVPGIGVKSARLIVASRRFSKLGFYQLKKIGVVMKKAQYFITCSELPVRTVNEMTPQRVRNLLVQKPRKKYDDRQLILDFGDEENDSVYIR